MNDTPFAAIHRTEVKRPARLLDPLGRRCGAQPQFLDPQHSIIVGVEAKPRMMIRRKPERLHGQKFERQQHLGFVSQQNVDVGPGEFHQNIGRFQVGMRIGPIQEFVLDIQIHVVENQVQELFQPGSRLRDGVLGLFHWMSAYFFLGVTFAGTGGGGIVLLIIHCVRIPTKLLVSQYNTTPAAIL